MSKAAYLKQKNTAKARGIEWLFDFESWLSMWTMSGKLAERGRGTGRYVMARCGDVGPYSQANVEIITYEKNASDCRTNHPLTVAQRSAQFIGKGRGWTYVRGGYQVSCAKKYVGRFRTQADAEVAYNAAVATRTAWLEFQGGPGK